MWHCQRDMQSTVDYVAARVHEGAIHKRGLGGNQPTVRALVEFSKLYTVKQENCRVVLLYLLMDDTPTIEIFLTLFLFMCIFVYKNAGVRDFYCAVNHCPHV